jgi:tyrosyl-tRNA synthetase
MIETPKNTQIFRTNGGKTIIDILTESKLCSTRNEARRLIKQGAIKWFPES